MPTALAIMQFPSSVIHHHIMDLINSFWRSNLNRASRTFIFTCAHMAILKTLINL
uniref:Uncharacterized protein n=1 Tax=Lepeophtheirus salmonis TaxID=72036 RepID=A0A0K2UJV0_LEPSM